MPHCQSTPSEKDQLVSRSVLAIQRSSGPHSNRTDLSFPSRTTRRESDKNCARCRTFFATTSLSPCHPKQDQPITRSILAIQTSTGHRSKALELVYTPQVFRRRSDSSFARHCPRLSGFSPYLRLFDLSCPSLHLYTSYLCPPWLLSMSTRPQDPTSPL